MPISEVTARRLKQIGGAMAAMAFFQLVLCTLSILLIFWTKDGNNPIDYKALVAAGFGAFSSLLGIAGALGKLELITRVYYVFNLWMLSTITTYLYMSIDEETQKRSLCSPALNSFAKTSNSCGEKLAMAKGKLSLGVISLLVVFICCILSSNFEDSLDDMNDQLLAEKLERLREETAELKTSEMEEKKREANESALFEKRKEHEE